MNRLFRIILIAPVLLAACAPARTQPPTATLPPAAEASAPTAPATEAPSPTPEPTKPPEPSPTPIEWIEGEVEIGVNLLDNAENHQWVLSELKRMGVSENDINKLQDPSEVALPGFTGPDHSMLTTENLKAEVIIGYRTIELPGHPGGKLRCLIVNGTAEGFEYAMPFALDAQDADGTWTLLLPGVDAGSTAGVAKWVEENRFKLVRSMMMINLLTDPKYLDDPSWLNGLPGDEGLRNRIIGASYVGWGTRDPYALAINGEKRRAQKATLEQMTHGAIGLGFFNLMDTLYWKYKHDKIDTPPDQCLIGASISVK